MIGKQFLQNMCELSLAYARGQSFENTGDFQESGWGKDAVKRRIACLFLAVVLAAALLGGCTDTGEPAVTQMGEGTYKIAIITGTTSQGEEEYRAAEGMKQMYGDRIVTSVYPDNAAQETDVTMQRVQELIADPDVKVLIFCQAVVGAKAAVEKARETRDDILYLCGIPGEDPEQIASAADVVLAMDVIGVGNVLIQQAKAMGAKTFVHVSFPRHMAADMGIRRHDLLKENAEREGLVFVDVEVPDPMGEGGPAATQKAVREMMPLWVEEYGKDTAFFATNCSIQEPLILGAVETGAIVPLQCCPSPLHGFPGALGIEIPQEQQGNMEYVIQEIRQKLAEKGADGSRFATWPVPMGMGFIQAGVEYGICYMEGETEGKNDEAVLQQCLDRGFGAGSTLSHYPAADGSELPNFYLVMCDFITFEEE